MTAMKTGSQLSLPLHPLPSPPLTGVPCSVRACGSVVSDVILSLGSRTETEVAHFPVEWRAPSRRA